MTPTVILIGLPGTGKSSTGRRLAKILAVRFADSDDLVEKQAGRSVAQLFADEGEPAFREREAQVIEGALARFDGVLALGGGALGTARTRDAITASAVPVVLLEAGVGTLAARVGSAQTRPLLTADPAARLRALADERAAAYRAAATFAVDTDSRTPGQVAATIAARLHDLALNR